MDLKSKTNCQIILEPGEAVVFQSGVLVGEILDYLHGDNDIIPHIGITDISPVCHMPDVIEAPYRPTLMNEPVKGKKVVLWFFLVLYVFLVFGSFLDVKC